MPTYTFACVKCSSKVDLLRSVKDRNLSWDCSACGSKMERRPEPFTPDTFTPHFDEGLGSDVYSKADKKRVMAQLDLVEAGDRVGGSRNFDKHCKNPVARSDLQGRRHNKYPEVEEKVLEVVDEKGRSLDKVKMGDLPKSTDAVNWTEI